MTPTTTLMREGEIALALGSWLLALGSSSGMAVVGEGQQKLPGS